MGYDMLYDVFVDISSASDASRHIKVAFSTSRSMR